MNTLTIWNKTEPKHLDSTKRLICDQSNKNNYFIHYNQIKSLTFQRMKVAKVQGKVSCKGKPCLKANLSRNPKKDAATHVEY